MSDVSVQYKQGVVAAARPGFCRVRFDDLDGLESAWLPVIHPKTQNDKVVWTLDVGEHVACVMDRNMEDGCILGAMYSEVDLAPVDKSEKFCVQFRDGGAFEYDYLSGAMNVVCKGAVNLCAEGPVTVQASSVLLDTPSVTCTGSLVVQGMLTYQGGMSGAGGNGSAAVIQGDISVQGSVRVSGSIMDAGGNSNHHSH